MHVSIFSLYFDGLAFSMTIKLDEKMNLENRNVEKYALLAEWWLYIFKLHTKTVFSVITMIIFASNS